MNVTPTEQPEANIQSASPSTEAAPKGQPPNVEGYYYQAIGWLHGVIAQNEEEKKFYMTLNDGTLFRLTAKPHILFAISQQVSKNPDVALWIRCYPQYRMLQQDLFFSVISYNVEKPEEARDKIFIFRGIWQFIPQSKRPVFSIYRNQVQEGERIKNQHLPVIWKEEPPFRFRKESEARPQFFQIEARLLTQRACFGFSKSLSEAAKPPKRVRLPGQTPPPRTGGFINKPKSDEISSESAQNADPQTPRPERSKPLPKPRKKSEIEESTPLPNPETVAEVVMVPEETSVEAKETTPETVAEVVVVPEETPVEVKKTTRKTTKKIEPESIPQEETPVEVKKTTRKTTKKIEAEETIPQEETPVEVKKTTRKTTKKLAADESIPQEETVTPKAKKTTGKSSKKETSD